ncbi:MAG: hypothetical protein WCO56_07420 [Verrucomicrobiota bacterium]
MLKAVQDFFITKDCQFVRQTRNDLTHTSPPLLLRMRGLAETIRNHGVKLGGVGIPYQHGFVCEYRSDDGGKLEVAIDVRDGKVYRVTLIEATNVSKLFPGLSKRLNGLPMPVSFEQTPGNGVLF